MYGEFENDEIATEKCLMGCCNKTKLVKAAIFQNDFKSISQKRYFE